MASTTKYPISSLPLPPPSLTITKNLTPDPLVPSPALFRNVQLEKPSVQRRARLLDASAHFSYCAPYPAAFPYHVTPPEDKEEIDQAAYVEKWLAEREAVHERGSGAVLKKFYSDEAKVGERPVKLIGLSETGLRDCVPHLDVGDAFALLGVPSLTVSTEDTQNEATQDNVVRQELIDVLSGSAVLANVDVDLEKAWAPWSLRYSGHQFGNWAGQLGDGRAISVLVTPHPKNPELTYELQLKGSGRTPFSRTADGLAVVRSSIREFLCAEAMQALGIATTRSLSLITHPSIPVERERLESACVLTRMAPSFIRVGSFEALNPPERMFFLGGGQQDAHHDALRVLGEWVGRHVLRLTGIKWKEEGSEGDAWGRELALESARRNAKMVAGWQAYGFMHGVINTDNVSIMGLTIDYGPYAFMDVFDQYHVCNHSDSESRYAYHAQPSVVLFALRALLNALSPLIGAEIAGGNKAVQPGWANDVTAEQLEKWSKEGKEAVLRDLEDLFQNTCAEEYKRLMHKRLGLRRLDSSDESKLSRPLLDLMADHRLDFHGTFRRLAYFRPSMAQPAGDGGATPALDDFAESLLALTPEPEMVDKFKAKADFKTWFHTYAERIESERSEWDSEADFDAAREREMRAANPRFVLRQWVLEEVIKKTEKDAEVGKRVISKVLQMACNPFEPWGAEDDPTPEEELDAETKEERRYCGLGEKMMLGFQCSCSS